MRRVKVAGGVLALLGVAALFCFLMLGKSPQMSGYIFTTDTALSTEAHYIRHRSMTDLYEVFGMGPGLLPYFASDYTYAPPPYLNAHGELR